MEGLIKKIKVMGDSILKGIQVDREADRYVVENNIDSVGLSQEFGFQIENCSRFGCTVTKAWSLLSRALDRGDSPDIVLMDFGGNDCDFVWPEIDKNPEGEHLPKTPLPQFLSTYTEMVQALRSKGIKPIITNLPPIAPDRYLSWLCRKESLNEKNLLLWLGDVNAIYRYQENYSNTVVSFAREENIPLVDIRGAFLKNMHLGSYLCEDGIHPNTAGQALMTEAFRTFIKKEQAA